MSFNYVFNTQSIVGHNKSNLNICWFILYQQNPINNILSVGGANAVDGVRWAKPFSTIFIIYLWITVYRA